jgi:hypothetical protein
VGSNFNRAARTRVFSSLMHRASCSRPAHPARRCRQVSLVFVAEAFPEPPLCPSDNRCPSGADDHQPAETVARAVEECPAEPGPQPHRRTSDSGSGDTTACPVAADVPRPRARVRDGRRLKGTRVHGDQPLRQ